jgi:hypothetical protein
MSALYPHEKIVRKRIFVIQKFHEINLRHCTMHMLITSQRDRAGRGEV